MNTNGGAPLQHDMMHWIERITTFGIRRPGTAGDLATEHWLVQKLSEFGLADVHLEPVPVNCWEPSQTALRSGTDGCDIPCFPIPYTGWTPAMGIVADAAYVSAGTNADFDAVDVSGKLVIADMQFGTLSAAMLRASSHFVYDPNQTIPDGVLHAANWLITNFGAYYEALRRGAVGFIGLLRDSPIDGPTLYAPYDGYLKELPGVWVGRELADAVVQRAITGEKLRLESIGTTGQVESHNVVGTVPGAGDESILMSCHHDAPFASAVEDGSGLSVLLSLARTFATRADRLHRSLIFVMSSGHFHGGVGNRVFVRRHQDGLLRRTVAAIGVEHIAEEVEGSSTGYRLTGQPEVRALFVGNNPRLIELVQEAVVRWDLERTIAVPPYLFGPEPPCDTAPYFTAGIPSLCHITGPLYLFDHHDTIDKVRAEDLPRVAGFVDQLICNLDRVPADSLEIGLARHRDDPPAPPPPWFLPPEV